jgi:hypothetical protein
MKFFVPNADLPQGAARVYGFIKGNLEKKLGAEIYDRPVHALRLHDDGSALDAQVGQFLESNNELVLAILFEPARRMYHICTRTRGAFSGDPISVPIELASSVVYFDAA